MDQSSFSGLTLCASGPLHSTVCCGCNSSIRALQTVSLSTSRCNERKHPKMLHVILYHSEYYLPELALRAVNEGTHPGRY